MQPATRERETQWIEQARRGDDQAFGKLVDAYQGPVFNLCYRILGDASEAEDAAQEAFIRAYRSLGRYDGSRKFVNWMLTIASNYSIDQVRKRRIALIPIEKALGGHDRADRENSLERALERKQSELEVRQILGSLSQIDRGAVVLRYWHELSYEEIGEILNLSVGGVRSRLHRSRKAMAEAWLAGRSAGPIREPSDEPSTV